jgi:hypothetical protein
LDEILARASQCVTVLALLSLSLRCHKKPTLNILNNHLTRVRRFQFGVVVAIVDVRWGEVGHTLMLFKVVAECQSNIRVLFQVELLNKPSVVTSKPANGGQGKTGQLRWPGTRFFYPVFC